jgi:hypothetical protein
MAPRQRFGCDEPAAPLTGGDTLEYAVELGAEIVYLAAQRDVLEVELPTRFLGVHAAIPRAFTWRA